MTRQENDVIVPVDALYRTIQVGSLASFAHMTGNVQHSFVVVDRIYNGVIYGHNCIKIKLLRPYIGWVRENGVSRDNLTEMVHTITDGESTRLLVLPVEYFVTRQHDITIQRLLTLSQSINEKTNRGKN